MGPISYYTFERIGVDHTITAAFAPEHAGGQQVLDVYKRQSLTYVYTGMLRSARHLRYTVTGPDGTVYYAKDVEYEPKSVYDNNYFQVVPAGVNDYDAFDPWYGTDATGSSLPNNAKATVRVEAELIYDEHEANNQRLSLIHILSTEFHFATLPSPWPGSMEMRFRLHLPSVCNAWNESAGRCVPGWMCRTLQFSGISGVLRRMQSGITCAWPRP